jgi:hypothetical protein
MKITLFSIVLLHFASIKIQEQINQSGIFNFQASPFKLINYLLNREINRATYNQV